tara:strand:+ start:547 stop:1068 length:522 start_codon:yes stop_codon:yes gene_type:complete
MKQILVIILFVSFVLSEKTDITFSNGWNGSISYGFLSEKTPVSIIEYSGLYNINEHSEFYVTFGTMLFASGIGLGYKYYFKNKAAHSIFVSFGSHLSHLGTADDQGMTIYGLSISPGYSIFKEGKSSKKFIDKVGREHITEYKKTSTNIGLSFMYMGDNSMGVFPFIYIERRF